MRLNWILWLVVLVGVLTGGFGLAFALDAQGADTPARLVRLVAAVAAGGWLVFGLFRWQHVGWVARTTVMAATVAGFLALAVVIDALGFPRGSRFVLSTLAMLGLFWGGVALLRVLLRVNLPIFGVARAVVEEALRSRLAVSFILLLFVKLPAIQIFVIAAETRVEYQIKSFLVFSLLTTGTLLGFLTVLFSAWSVAQEREQKQIFLTLTKPVTRIEYLAGKWLGIGLLNAVLVTIAGLGIYLFTQQLEKIGDYQSPEDRSAVEQRVLVARQAVPPRPNTADHTFAAEMARRMQEIADDNNVSIDSISAKIQRDVADQIRKEWYTLGNPMGEGGGAEQEFAFLDVPRLWNPGTAKAAMNRAAEAGEESDRLREIGNVREELALAPASPERRHAVALLNAYEAGEAEAWLSLWNHISATMPGESVQLQFKPRAGGETENDRVRLLILANGYLVQPPQYDPSIGESSDMSAQIRNSTWLFADNTRSVVTIGPEFLNDDGTLVISVANHTFTGSSVNFSTKDGIQLLYRRGNFEPNFAKTLVLLWVRLMFIAAVAIAAASVLTFPVAALLAVTVYFASVGAHYLGEALDGYSQVNNDWPFLDYLMDIYAKTVGTIGDGEWYETFKVWVVVVAEGVLFLTPDLSTASATSNIRDGMLVETGTLLRALGQVLVVASGVALVLGWVAFRKRELARVIV